MEHRGDNMGDMKNYLREQFQKGKQIGGNPEASTGEAIKQVLEEVKSEYSAASDYAQCRKKRKQDIAERLHELRLESGLRQQEIADKIGVGFTTLSGYEVGRNEASAEALVRLADIYGVSLDYLMCRTDEKPETRDT